MHTSILLTIIVIVQASSNIRYLENCTYSLELYKEYLNVLWSSNDSRTLHIQASYSLSSSSSSPGQISTISSQSLALIPFLIQCQTFPRQSFLPFTQCSSTITNELWRKNSEFTRTQLNLQTMFSMYNVPSLYLGEYHLILFNCSFHSNSTMIYRLKSDEFFAFRIEYETPVRSNCQSCNRRTSICYENICRCRSGTVPVALRENEQFCVDITRNCSLDGQRCLYNKSIEKNYSNELIFLLLILIGLILVLFVGLFCYFYRYSKERKTEEDCDSSMDKHQRTPSTISTIDSIKLTVEHPYPKIIGEEKNGEIVYILV